MVDNVSKDKRSQTMKAVKSHSTSIENKVMKAIWKRGIRYRKNVKDLKGKPDIAIKKYRCVIFIDSCFWHGCPEHCRIPQTNVEYWLKKISRNKERDRQVNEYYEREEWNILRVWEHEISKDLEKTILKIFTFIEASKEKVLYNTKE
ncbi:very short patch repair endonuclease [Paenibacillus elgii]|uniref:Very short patch repair endonuclease n=1 Tax=Paenibacillus elgii TaxID=189691 RepID=A0A2T6FS46_9BACL|nr:very short patch repair endonuclease [Paenibacillus elgii]PUA34707.1 very short patch repair endonuclease [Paenibacillus elgii]